MVTELSSIVRAGALLVAAAVLAEGSANAGTLDDVRNRDRLICGVSDGLPGFSLRHPEGDWTGFDVDYCRALAAALFNDPTKVKFTPLSTKDRFTALQSGEVDILSRNTTWTLDRDTKLGLNFIGMIIDLSDGAAFAYEDSIAVTLTKLPGSAAAPANGDEPLYAAIDFRDDRRGRPVRAFVRLSPVDAGVARGRP